MRSRLVVFSLMALALLLLAACSGGFATHASKSDEGNVGEPATSAPTINYQMVQVKTRTPTPGPVTPKPTATLVPLITPSAVVGQTPAAAAASAASIPRISLQAAKASLDSGAAVLVDVRTAAAYQQKHAAGAISMPSNEVANRYKELPTDKQIILYCA